MDSLEEISGTAHSDGVKIQLLSCERCAECRICMCLCANTFVTISQRQDQAGLNECFNHTYLLFYYM